MARILTGLSVLAGWSLLGVLGWGLMRIIRLLQSIRGHLEQIAMGVRAIEQETAPLGARVTAVGGSLGKAVAGGGAAVARLAAVDQALGAAGQGLGPAIQAARRRGAPTAGPREEGSHAG